MCRGVWDELTVRGESRVFVVALAAVGEVLDQSVDEHVAGAGVEGEDIGRLGISGDYGEVGDAADVEADASEFFVAVEKVIGEGD